MTTPLVRLPTYHTSLIGRAHDVTALTDYLQDPHTRMITLVGASGSGKTRLALEVATHVQSAFADGVVFVGLAPVQDVRFVLPTIAKELDVEEHGDTSILSALSAYLADRRMLLILDNIEQVQAVGEDLSTLLAAAPQLTVLLTSQVALAVAQEAVYQVPPLGVPAAGSRLDPVDVLAYPGVALFVERLQAVQPRFTLTPQASSAVVRICQLLDGYPLAIELVAAHSAALDPDDLLLLLRNHLAMRPHQADPAFSSRSAILNPVLDWCISRLPDLGKRCMQRLGIFQGGWTLAAAHAVLAPEEDLETVAETLAVLVQKHLVLLETLPDQERRYTVLDAVHEYSATFLQRKKQDSIVATRHAAYFQTLAIHAEQGLRGSEQGRWLHHLDEEIHNLRSAMAWGLNYGKPDVTLRMSADLFLYWQLRSWYAEGRYWLNAALQAPDHASTEYQAKAWKAFGVLSMWQGAYEESLHAYRESLRFYDMRADHEGKAAVLNNIAGVYAEQGNIGDAQRLYEQSLASFRAAPEPNLGHVAKVISNIGVMCEQRGYYRDASMYQAESLDLRQKLGDQAGMANSLLNLASCTSKAGKYSQAHEYLIASQRIAEALGDQRTLAGCLAGLGDVALSQGVYGEAEQRYLLALDLFTTAGNQREQAIIYRSLGLLSLLQDQWKAARQWLDQSARIVAALHEQLLSLRIKLDTSRLALAQHHFAGAWAALHPSILSVLAADNRELVLELAELTALLGDHGAMTKVRPNDLWHVTQALRHTWEIPLSTSLATWYERYSRSPFAVDTSASTPSDEGTLRTMLETLSNPSA